MGYIFHGLISHTTTLDKVHPHFLNWHVVGLNQGISIIPFTNKLFKEIEEAELKRDGKTIKRTDFLELTSAIETLAVEISKVGAVGWIEAEFHGGSGDQGAVCWDNGLCILGPIRDQKAINQVLRLLNVRLGFMHDEFAAVGLRKHRDTHDWLKC
jgi:hypothetical protein